MLKNTRRKYVLGITLFVLVMLAFGAYTIYHWIEGPNVELSREEVVIYLESGSSFEEMVQLLQDSQYLKRPATFEKVASWMEYENSNFKTGRYTLKNGMSNHELISLLRSGRQTPVMVTINNVRNLDQLAGKITSYLEIDSLTYYQFLIDSAIQVSNQLDSQTLLTLFLPNSYELFWDVTAYELTERMAVEHQRFWESEDRKVKARKLGLDEEEVYTLASIVERETQTASERPRVAGLYLNRMKRGIPLQADPTIVYAVGDFNIRRVLNKHLMIDSPYNTYLYPGLPPGPICMPSINSIDAILEAEDHNYLYMCAKPDSREHVFAASLAEHNRNASRYRRWLNQKGIMQ